MAEPISTTTILALTAVAKGVNSLVQHGRRKDAAENAQDDLRAKKSGIMEGKVGLTQSFEGELELSDERLDKNLKQLTKTAGNKLEGLHSTIRDSGSTLSGSGRTETTALKAEESMWDTFMSGADDMRTKTEDDRIGAYSRMFSGATKIESEYDDLKSKIKQLDT